MDRMEFIEKSRNLVMENYNKMLMEQRISSPFQPSLDNLKFEETYCVWAWMCETLQNAKGLFAASREGREGDDLYFEVTYNGDKKEFYVDRYKKQDNERVAYNE